MASRNKQKSAQARSDEALGKLEKPQIKWKIIIQIIIGFVVLWVLAIMAMPYISFWGIGVMGVLTLLAAGLGFYLWWMMKKQSGLIEILQSADSAEGRKAAIERLSQSGESKDAMKSLARAQLVARENPNEAIKVLEEINIEKAQRGIQDEVRANLAMLYLVHNRVKEARALVNDIRVDKQPQIKSKALYTGVIAEAYARTGRAQEAKKLVETYSDTDPQIEEVRTVLLRAKVFTYMATKNRGLANKAMADLASMDPNMVAAFTQKGTHPELQQMAKKYFSQAGLMPKPKARYKVKI